MVEEVPGTGVWRVLGPKSRAFAWVWLPLTSAFLLATLFFDDVPAGTLLAAIFNVIAAAGFMIPARTKTVADERGLAITQLRTRHIPWTDVAHLGTDTGGRWATSVRVTLDDDSTITLPAVPVADLPRLEELRL